MVQFFCLLDIDDITKYKYKVPVLKSLHWLSVEKKNILQIKVNVTFLHKTLCFIQKTVVKLTPNSSVLLLT